MVKNIRASCLIAIESNSNHVLVLVCVRSWKLLRDGFVLSTKHIRKGNNSFFDPFLPRFFSHMVSVKNQNFACRRMTNLFWSHPTADQTRELWGKGVQLLPLSKQTPENEFLTRFVFGFRPISGEKSKQEWQVQHDLFSSDITKRKQIFGMNALRSCDTLDQKHSVTKLSSFQRLLRSCACFALNC